MIYMVVVYRETSVGGRIICFWNPYVRRRYCFLFGRIDRQFRIIRFLRQFCACSTATFTSITERHYSKNLHIESMLCVTIKDEEYRHIEDDREFEDLIEEKIDRIEAYHGECFNLFGVEYEIRGVEFRADCPNSYCCSFRQRYTETETLAVIETVKCRCYDHRVPLDVTPLTDICEEKRIERLMVELTEKIGGVEE